MVVGSGSGGGGGSGGSGGSGSSSSSILYLPSDCRVALTANVSEYFHSTMGRDQTTTPGTSCPALYD